MCQKCFSTISRGKPHVCTFQNKIENLINAAGTAREQIAARILTDKLNITPATSNDIKTASLKRPRGHPLNISILSKKAKIEVETPPPIDVNVLKNIQIDTRTSTNQVKKIVKNLKTSSNKTVIERGTIKKLNEDSHSLDHFFSTETLTLDGAKHVKVATPVVYCHALNDLVSYLLEKRQITENYFVKIGIDGGGGSLKVVYLFVL